MKKIIYILLCVANCIVPIIDLYNKIIAIDTNITFQEKNNNDFLLSINSSFSVWICGINPNRAISIYFYILLASTLIFCYLFSSEEKKKKITENRGKKIYIKAFIMTGGLSAFPITLNLLVISMFAPSLKPDSAYDIFYGVFSDNIFGDFFYRHILLYIFIFELFVFIYWGIIGCIGCCLSNTFKYKIISLLFEGVIILLVHYIQYKTKTNIAFSPLSIFTSYRCLYENYKIILIEIVILLLFIELMIIYSSKHNKFSSKNFDET